MLRVQEMFTDVWYFIQTQGFYKKQYCMLHILFYVLNEKLKDILGVSTILENLDASLKENL